MSNESLNLSMPAEVVTVKNPTGAVLEIDIDNASSGYKVIFPVTNAAGSLSNNGSGTLSWSAATPADSNFMISSSQISVTSATAVTVAYFAWDQSLYTSFPAGVCTFWAANMATGIGNRGITVDIHDGTGVIGSGIIPAGTADGIQTFSITNPTSDKRLSIRVTKSAAAGTDPDIFGIQLKF